MPQPAHVASAADRLVARYRQAMTEWVALVDATRTLPPADRLRRLLVGVDQIFRSLDVDVRDWVGTATPQVWAAGSRDLFGPAIATSFTQAHFSAIQALAAQNYTELLTATTHVQDATKRALREMARTGVLDTLNGQTASKAGLTQVNVRQDAHAQPMTVTYANGAEHSLADWADTAVRTQSARAYNAGTLGTCKSFGIEWVELADGPACGLTSHDDPELANGLVVPIDTAYSYPLSHPRCARSILPRPDLSSQDDADAHNDSRDTETLTAEALVERQRAAKATVTGRRMTVRSEAARVERRVRAGRTSRPARPT